MQTTSHLLMVRPIRFGFNPETAVNNAFQKNEGSADVQAKVLAEFDSYVATLRANDINVLVVNDTPEPHTPDSIFPNNWVSFHSNGVVCLYPMFAANRRLERKPGVLEAVQREFVVAKTIDFTHYESKNLFLEGTGSMIFDRTNMIAYACLSPRTAKDVFLDFCGQLGFKPAYFTSTDAAGQPVYHTNVMMCVAEQYAVICLASIRNAEERERLVDVVEKSGKKVISITMEQMGAFAGNMLQVRSSKNELLLVMSNTAYSSLSKEQLASLNRFNRIVCVDIQHIETNGGGSARCMLAEIFLPKK